MSSHLSASSPSFAKVRARIEGNAEVDHDHNRGNGVLAVSPAEAGRLAGVGRTTIYQAISCGDLKSLKIGARRLVTVEALRQWLLKHEVGP